MPPELEQARRLLTEAPVIDGHNDLPWAVRTRFGYDLDRYDLSQRQDQTHTDLVRLREGGVGAQFWSVYVPSSLPPAEAVVATLEQVDFVHRMVARYPEQLALVDSGADAAAAWRSGRLGCLIGAEGGHSIAGSLAVLRQLRILGVRYLTLTHFDNAPWADSATDVRVLGGLSDFGREVVRELDRLGMLVDLAHVSAETMRDALAVSTQPVLFTHSCAHALVGNPRNVPDDVLTQLPANGGVCMVAFVPSFVSPAVWNWERELRDELARSGQDWRDHAVRAAATERRLASHPRPRATVADVADHVEHVREVAGLEHVGIGGDFDGTDDLPDGLGDVAQYPALFAELLHRGWSPAECAAVSSGNLVRVLDATAQPARA